MAKVNAYHTNSEEAPPSHREVYHNHDDCADGKRIKPEHLEKGTGGKGQCKVCIKLDEPPKKESGKLLPNAGR